MENGVVRAAARWLQPLTINGAQQGGYRGAVDQVRSRQLKHRTCHRGRHGHHGVHFEGPGFALANLNTNHRVSGVIWKPKIQTIENRQHDKRHVVIHDPCGNDDIEAYT
ncbi:hypothetical protein L917_10783 [Phytophthora nicotianae]|uniref:Uncharacterized protein n=1 Tax=Phytophthora nicotianae TaxID=4792 RepID=W2KZE5_PHYNI|nr:hypothetical protein L917_10783 [Phytophthora nicotianae]